MGYSHYWYTTNIEKYIYPGIRKNISQEINKLIDILGFNRETSNLSVNEYNINIYRIEEEHEHNECFEFSLSDPCNLDDPYYRDRPDILRGFNSCKTNGVPKFDMLVMLSLLTLANNIHNFIIKSNGYIEDWKPAIKIYETHIRHLSFNLKTMLDEENENDDDL